MQLPWRSLRKPARHHAGSWPPTSTQWLLSALALSLALQWWFQHYNRPVSDAIVEQGSLSLAGVAAGHFWQPVTYLFLQGPPWMDFAALLALYIAGGNLEFIIGRRHLWQLYFLAGVAGGLGQLTYNAATAATLSASYPLAGSTAAVMGVFVALAVLMPDLELAPLLGFPLPFWLRIKHCAVAAVAGCAAIPLLYPNDSFTNVQGTRCLVGCLVGCFYMRQLGFGRRTRARDVSPEHEPMLQIPVFSQADAPHIAAEEAVVLPPKFTERERRMTPRQYISEQIDPILDKISSRGIDCLTSEERRILEKGRDKISQRDP